MWCFFKEKKIDQFAWPKYILNKRLFTYQFNLYGTTDAMDRYILMRI